MRRSLRAALGILVAVVLVLGLPGCTGDDETGVTAATAESGEAAVAAASGNAADHDDPADYTWDEADVIDITLEGDSASSDDPSVSAGDGSVTITAAGTYRVTGELTDGRIVVDTQDTAVVRLILNGVDITNRSGAAVYVASAEKVVVALADGTQNTLTDGDTYTYDDPEEEEPNAALFSKADLTIFGGGSLIIDANFNDGIASKDGLIIASGTITVDAVDDGIRGKDYLVVKGGEITVNAGGDAMKSDNDEDATMGYVSVAAGTLDLTSGDDGLDAVTDAILSGGSVTVATGGGSGTASGSGGGKGIKGMVSVVIDGGTVQVDAADDAIHSNGSISIADGTLVLNSGDDAVHADESITIGGGSLTVESCYEGIESALVTIDGGDIDITASDDGINLAGGNDGSAAATPRGKGDTFGGPNGGGGGAQAAGDYYLYINGGTTVIVCEGDGLDSNGSIEMTGGTVVVHGPTRGDNGAIDYNGTFDISGGVLVAACSDGRMAESPGSPSSQAVVYLRTNASAGDPIHLETADGADLLTFEPMKDVAVLVFSSPELQDGASYNVYLGGSADGENIGGLYAAGAYTVGDLAGTVSAQVP